MLTKIRPFLKAVAPAVLTVIAVLVDWLVQGTFDRETAAIAITGLCAAIITYFVPNTSLPVIESTVTDVAPKSMLAPEDKPKDY